MQMERSPDAFPTIGILGGGQLGRMTAMAAMRLGMRVRFLAPKPAGPMEGLGESFIGDWTDPEVLLDFAAPCDVVTVESEWAPAERIPPLALEEVGVWPDPATLHVIRDKGLQKTTLAEAGLPVPDFALCATRDEAFEAAERFGYPVVLKRFRGSYDGYGNAAAAGPDELSAGWERLAEDDGLLVEAWAPFVRELAVLVARRPDGAHVVYPVAFTEQRDHRCHAVVAPAGIEEAVAEEARRVALRAVETVGGVGITAVELFEMPDGRILINELAPRPHNTGHYTIEACHTSQFENHVRAILGWPLGDPSLRVPSAVMINVIGRRTGAAAPRGLTEALALPGVAVHMYGKREVRPGRKMGHVTATGTNAVETRFRAERAAELIHL